LDERLDAIERELGAPLYRELMECNALDMLLCSEARVLFDQAVIRQEMPPYPCSAETVSSRDS